MIRPRSRPAAVAPPDPENAQRLRATAGQVVTGASLGGVRSAREVREGDVAPAPMLDQTPRRGSRDVAVEAIPHTARTGRPATGVVYGHDRPVPGARGFDPLPGQLSPNTARRAREDPNRQPPVVEDESHSGVAVGRAARGGIS